MTQETWLTRDEMAAKLRMSTARLSYLVQEGCPHIRKGGVPGGHLLFRETDVVEWLAQRLADAEDKSERESE